MLNLGSKSKSSSRDQATNQLNLSPPTHKKSPNNPNCSLLYLRYILILSVILLIFLVFPPFYRGDGMAKDFSFHKIHIIIFPTGRTESEEQFQTLKNIKDVQTGSLNSSVTRAQTALGKCILLIWLSSLSCRTQNSQY